MHSDSGDPADYQSGMGDWIWIQLAVNDAAEAAAFYSAVGSYDVTDRLDIDATEDLLLSADGYARAGISEINDDRRPVWIPFVRVADAAESVEQALALGAELILPPWDEGPGSDLAVIADPNGAVIGLMTWDYGEADE